MGNDNFRAFKENWAVADNREGVAVQLAVDLGPINRGWKLVVRVPAVKGAESFGRIVISAASNPSLKTALQIARAKG